MFFVFSMVNIVYNVFRYFSVSVTVHDVCVYSRFVVEY